MIRSLEHLPRYKAPSSWWEHVPIAHLLIEEIKPKVVVELGTHYGVSFFSFCEAAEKYSPETIVYAIDTWEGDIQAGYYAENVYDKVTRHREEYHNTRGKLIRSTFDKATERFDDMTIDLLHIDGLHTYEAVKNDFDKWFPKMRQGGTIIFHDWNEQGEGFGVWRLWDEIKTSREFYCIEFENGHGLGIATLKSGIDIPGWHKIVEDHKNQLVVKGKLLDQLQTQSEKFDGIVTEKKTVEQHARNLEEIVEESKRYILSLEKELERARKSDIRTMIRRFLKRSK